MRHAGGREELNSSEEMETSYMDDPLHKRPRILSQHTYYQKNYRISQWFFLQLHEEERANSYVRLLDEIVLLKSSNRHERPGLVENFQFKWGQASPYGGYNLTLTLFGTRLSTVYIGNWDKFPLSQTLQPGLNGRASAEILDD